MKVGLYFDLRVPPGSGLDPARVYAHTLEMCEEAERAGLDSVWVSEHHAFDDGYLPQPLTFAAAIAARTRRVRIGTALIVAPLHSTVEIAEQAAVADLVSDGRLELGLGAGYRQAEFDLFGADHAGRFGTLARQVPDLRELWSGRVTPRPVQSPIPIWLGSGSPNGARRTGRLGADLLFLNPDLLPAYRQGRAEAGLDPSGGRMGGPFFALPSEDPERDWADTAPYITYQQNSYRRHTDVGRSAGGQRPFDPDAGRQRPLSRPGAFWFDTPENLATRLRAWLADTPVDTVFLWASVGGMPEPMVERNVELIARRLAPLLREDHRG
ncbi:LLM class flavin-dependent oxidoreductase [Nocardia alni]|uniref:LLM class flavin-dependent oxidoreductase n=1 Tax=Nocardia alni TaxID=2815723 RepID=UPI001C234BA9|nr:LLM class flavin-dependent oxidoreductase [Nocardia alni]